ncbi:MAG: signal recognition particle protein [Pseudomonadota bacterium]
MFNNLVSSLSNIFSKLTRSGVLKSGDLDSLINDLRTSLIDADVHHDVVNEFLKVVRERAEGAEIHKALSPAQQFLKIVNKTLTEILGGNASPINLSGAPAVIMLVGLQGSGKTTTAVKLAKYLKEKMGRNPILVGMDFNRPAAVEQLKILARENRIDFFEGETRNAAKNAEHSVKEAKLTASKNNNDTLIIDTAGRLHIDKELMDELKELKKTFNPGEILLIADSMLGQDAVNVAREFDSLLNINGFILTKMDSDARGGAALSLFHTTKKPIKFIGQGEKIDALDVFHPDRVASRILDMGDVLTLIERAEENFDKKEAEKLQAKLKKSGFDIEDFLAQIKQLKKLGSMETLLSMVPGFSGITGKLKGLTPPDDELKKIEALIQSMTVKERQHPEIINGSRRKRIALGSGVSVNDVNKFLKSFDSMKKLMKGLPKGGFSGLGNRNDIKFR